jgi:hypothetical protein
VQPTGLSLGFPSSHQMLESPIHRDAVWPLVHGMTAFFVLLCRDLAAPRHAAAVAVAPGWPQLALPMRRSVQVMCTGFLDCSAKFFCKVPLSTQTLPPCQSSGHSTSHLCWSCGPQSPIQGVQSAVTVFASHFLAQWLSSPWCFLTASLDSPGTEHILCHRRWKG